MMPNRDGFELLSQVKQEEDLKNIPFVMLTARADESDKLQALNKKVDDYILKPFYPKELQARINNLLLKKQIRLANSDDTEDSKNETEVLLSEVKAYI